MLTFQRIFLFILRTNQAKHGYSHKNMFLSVQQNLKCVFVFYELVNQECSRRQKNNMYCAMSSGKDGMQVEQGVISYRCHHQVS